MKKFWLFLLISVLTWGQGFAQVSGCTDPQALNYNAQATQNDGSCSYQSTSLQPSVTQVLDSCLSETSGIIQWNQRIWTLNDDTDNAIYGLDPATGAITDKVTLTHTVNRDWEEISQDSNYLYLGDFGNNATGNRTDLKILRVSKASVTNGGTLEIDTIAFAYANQTNFSNAGANNTDFDCEAMVVGSDSIYLFAKQWLSQKTVVYALPKLPGAHLAQPVDSLDVGGLITGATYLAAKKLVILCGYSKQLNPFLYLLYDFAPNRFFSGNKRKVDLTLSFRQIEGVSTADGRTLYCSNERFTYAPIVNNPQQLHTFDLSSLLGFYVCTGVNEDPLQPKPIVRVFPNPTANLLYVNLPKTWVRSSYRIINQQGRKVMEGILNEESSMLDVSPLKPGCYILSIAGVECGFAKFVKQ